MLVHPLSRTDEHIEDEHAPHVQSFYFLLTNALLWTKRDILDTPSVAPSSIGVVHGKGQLRKKNICATCHSLIGYQSCRLASSRWEPRVISWLVRVASYAQVSCLYIVEFLHYPLHLQNFLLWHSSSRASSRSLCIHRLLSSRSRDLLFFSSLSFQFSKNVWNFYSFV